MGRPFVLAFGPWLPDGADVAYGLPYQSTAVPVPLADVLNIYYAQGAYRSLPAFTPLGGGALPGALLGALTALDETGAPQIYAGAGADLYRWTGAAWVQASKAAGAYAGAQHWSMIDFAGCVLAVDGIHPLQDATVGSGNFADVAAAPIGAVIGKIGQSVIIGDIKSGLLGELNVPYRIYWSKIGDPTVWPVPLTDEALADQSSFEDLEQDFGAVMFIGGGPQLGVILQRHGITRAVYEGGDTVFTIVPVERRRGLIARGAAVQVGDLTHFICDDGFRVTDGSLSQPTGTNEHAALDKWFWSNVNQAALDAISAGWDADKECVVYAIPTGSSVLPDTLLLLNPKSGQWTRAQIAVERLFSDNDGKRHRLALIDQAHTLGYLTGAGLAGYCETYDLSFVDGRARSVSEAQPNIICTDEPTMRIGVKQAIDEAPLYTADAGRDSFSRRCTWDPPPEGLYARARLSSAAAQAFAGATLYAETAGAL